MDVFESCNVPLQSERAADCNRVRTADREDVGAGIDVADIQFARALAGAVPGGENFPVLAARAGGLEIEARPYSRQGRFHKNAGLAGLINRQTIITCCTRPIDELVPCECIGRMSGEGACG